MTIIKVFQVDDIYSAVPKVLGNKNAPEYCSGKSFANLTNPKHFFERERERKRERERELLATRLCA